MKKAKEYYELYKTDLTSADEDTALRAAHQLFIDLSDEVVELQKMRNVKYDRGMFKILKEINEKWNSIVHLFENEYGISPILPNGFKSLWLNQMPELKGKF